MLPPGLDTPRQVQQHYESIYDQHIATGDYVPFLYPWAMVGAGIILVYLLFDHRRSPVLQSLRFPLYGFLCAFSTWCILTNRARGAAASYGVGLCSSWGTLWTGAIMFFNDCQTDFSRIERSDSQAMSKKTSNGIVSNGSTKREDGTTMAEQNLLAFEKTSTQGPSQRDGPLFWQSYPSGPFIERLDWIVDVFINFRGVNWNFQTYGIPPLPSHIAAELERHERTPEKPNEITISKTSIQRFTNRTTLLHYILLRLLLGAIALDLIKTLMHHDPYFWGYTDAPPPHHLPPSIRASPALTKSYRLLLSLSGISLALMEIFRLGPLLFSLLLGPKLLGLRGEPWSNPPDFYGSFRPVLDSGLAGWWGSWWHQIFRFGFEAPATSLLKALGIEKKSPRGKTIALVVAFVLSGCLHACGSYTQLGDTRPIRGPFCFFALQPVGILAQMAAAQRLKDLGVTGKMPKVVRQMANFVAVLVWLYFTAPLLVDDFAKGGVWLYEPLAISPLRIVGFGAKDENGWDLWYGLIIWRTGRHWWDTGLAF